MSAIRVSRQCAVTTRDRLLDLLQYWESPWCRSDNRTVTLKRGGGGRRTREGRPPRGIAGGPRVRTNNEQRESRGSAQPRRIKPILPLKFNLGQPRDHQRHKYPTKTERSPRRMKICQEGSRENCIVLHLFRENDVRDEGRGSGNKGCWQIGNRPKLHGDQRVPARRKPAGVIEKKGCSGENIVSR